MKRKIIYQYVRELSTNGGVGGVAFFLGKEFEKKGYEVKNITLKNFIFGKTLIKLSKSQNLLIKKFFLFLSVVYYTLMGTLLLKINNFKNKYNISIVHNDVLGGDIYINHGLHKVLLKQNGYMKMFLKNPLHLFLYMREEIRHKFNTYKYIVSFSKSDKKDLISLYSIDVNKIKLIPNGIDLENFRFDNKKRDIIRNKMNVRENDFVLIFIGHEFERKGLKFLISAMQYLNESFKLWIIGGNNTEISKYKKYVRKLNIKNIKFFGFQKNVVDFLNGADLFILPSSHEAWPLVGLEAMATGKPVLATFINGFNEFIKEGENGFFIKQDEKDIAEKIKHVYENKDLYEKLKKGALDTAKQYSWDKVADKYIEVIDKVSEIKQGIKN